MRKQAICSFRENSFTESRGWETLSAYPAQIGTAPIFLYVDDIGRAIRSLLFIKDVYYARQYFTGCFFPLLSYDASADTTMITYMPQLKETSYTTGPKRIMIDY